MRAFAPAGSSCPRHPQAAAIYICSRCGGFLCAQCEHRVRPDAPVLCASCWELRAQRVAETIKVTGNGGKGLGTTGLVLGILSIFPLPPLMLASLVINIFALTRSERGTRTKPVVGLVLTLAFGFAWLVALVVAMAFDEG